MDTLAILQRLLLALAIGLLVGIERGWQERDGKEGSRAAGVRTFALIGLLGGVSALLSRFAGPLFLGFAIIAFAAALLPFVWREAEAAGSSSATGMIAGLVTFALGAYAVIGNASAAAAGGIAATIILAERKVLHEFVSQLKWSELRAALLLLTMTFVLLPILPDRTVDPWDALNPRQLWLMMVVIAAVSYVGYICVRVAGERAGLIYAAAAGGLVSSTAVTLAYSRLSAKSPQSAMALASGVTAAWTVSLLRQSSIAVALAPAMLAPLGSTLGPPAALLAVITLVLYLRAAKLEAQSPLVLSDPFELSEVLRFGLLLAVVLLAAKLSGSWTHELSLIPLAAASGAVDVDPITLSAAKLTGTTIAPAYAATVVMVAAGSNVVCKSTVALLLGSRAFAGYVLGAAIAAAAVAAAAWYVLG
ncbi:MAG: DUF4010 domain-containing protein [Rhizomicrobium sp.]